MYPLRRKQLQKLNDQGNADLARKVDEIVVWINRKENKPKKKSLREKISDNIHKLANWIE